MTDSTKVDNVLQFLEICSKIEGLSAELYNYYSELFLEDKESSQLWKKTALEEENHQKLFELAIKLRNECELEIVADYNKACRVYDKLSKLLSHVQESPPDIFLAITKAIEMEVALADLHIDSATNFKDVQIKNMFIALQGHDQEHIGALRRHQAVLFLPRTEMEAS
jgi:rubrerythrin